MSVKDTSFNCLIGWGKAVAQKDKAAVLHHYLESATLWPTLSNELRQSQIRISDYFDHFLPKINGPVDWQECCFQPISDSDCVWSGTYAFQLQDGTATARFTYLLTLVNQDWKIRHHHSSLTVDEAAK